jgi:hypothetical protein
MIYRDKLDNCIWMKMDHLYSPEGPLYLGVVAPIVLVLSTSTITLYARSLTSYLVQKFYKVDEP